MIEGDAPLASLYLSEDLLDARGFDVGKPATLNDLRQFGGGHVCDLVPARVSLTERSESPTGVEIARVLRQDRLNELLERVAPGRLNFIVLLLAEPSVDG